ncbi:hypothetical protein INT47_011654 [Mucor saturninus]|uniref:Uncharacterized protein n=1 Tax=Mucor saturninus TaxID=64648 RepID=A0A8H7QJ97_9FUNG|nr:hypothetical protein INT47_011654 [Mucor saturninus]
MQNNTLPRNKPPTANERDVDCPETLPSHANLTDMEDLSMENIFQFAGTSKDLLSQSSLPEVPSNNSSFNRTQTIEWPYIGVEQKISGIRNAGNFDFTVPENFIQKLGSNASKYSDTNASSNNFTRNKSSNNHSTPLDSAKQSTADCNTTKATKINNELPKTTFANMTKKPVPFKTPRKRTTSKQRKAAARIFEAPAETTSSNAFLYLYLPNKYRVRIKEFRRKLQTMGIDNGRILDIHYPARGVVALLIHHSYQVELDSIFTKSDITPVKQFDPTAATHVNDPSLRHLTADKRASKAVEFHQTRLILGLKFIRSYLGRTAQSVLSATRSGNDNIKTPDNIPNNLNVDTPSNFDSSSSGLEHGTDRMESDKVEDEHMDTEDETPNNSLPGAGQPAHRQ